MARHKKQQTGTGEDLTTADPRVLQGLRERLDWGSRKDGQSGCLEWQGRVNADGYVVVHALGRVWYGHRLRWMLKNGAIPEGHYVCHHCDNRKCLEETHLFLGTVADNLGDMFTKGRNAWGLRPGQGRSLSPEELEERARKKEEERMARLKRKEEMRQEVLKLRGAGATYWEIADALGISPTTAWAICRKAPVGVEAGVKTVGGVSELAEVAEGSGAEFGVPSLAISREPEVPAVVKEFGAAVREDIEEVAGLGPLEQVLDRAIVTDVRARKEKGAAPAAGVGKPKMSELLKRMEKR